MKVARMAVSGARGSKLQKLRIISRPIARGSAASLSPFQTRWPECMMEARLETTGSFLRHPITCASLKCYLIVGRWTDVRSNDYSSHRRPILHRGGLEYRTAGCVAHGSDLGRRTRSIAADV